MKKVVTMILILISLFSCTNFCYARQEEYGGEIDKSLTEKGITIEVDKSKNKDKTSGGIMNIDSVEEPKPMDASEITDRAGIISSVIRTIGIIVSVIALVYIGI